MTASTLDELLDKAEELELKYIDNTKRLMRLLGATVNDDGLAKIIDMRTVQAKVTNNWVTFHRGTLRFKRVRQLLVAQGVAMTQEVPEYYDNEEVALHVVLQGEFRVGVLVNKKNTTKPRG